METTVIKFLLFIAAAFVMGLWLGYILWYPEEKLREAVERTRRELNASRQKKD